MISVILCAAGSGTRAGLPENKILSELNGLPVLCYSLSAFAPYADEMLVTCREQDEPRILPLLSPYPQAHTVRGGATRAASVFAALGEVKGDIVLVHDAARPFVTSKLIERVIESVKKYGSGVCVLPVTDTMLLGTDGYIGSQISRDTCFAAQTPQGFFTKDLYAAYREAKQFFALDAYTDDSGIYASYIGPCRMCMGDAANRKLTYPEDFRPAERVGFGTDTHAFGSLREGAVISLCGVKIPAPAPLLAHSDGDVAVHALMDALLSAIGERDIGHRFPDSDPAYAGADSMQLLAQVMKTVNGVGFSVKNAAISIVCELPRLAPHIGAMQERIRDALGCESVGIAAGTNEKLGYVGEGKGITAFATVLLAARRA